MGRVRQSMGPSALRTHHLHAPTPPAPDPVLRGTGLPPLIWPLVTIVGAAICGGSYGIFGSVSFALAVIASAGWLHASAAVVSWSGEASPATALAAAVVSYVGLILLFGSLLYSGVISKLPAWPFASGLVAGVAMYAFDHIRKSWFWSQAR